MFPAPFSPHDWLSSLVCMVEQLVPVRQEGIALAYSLTDQCSVFWTKQPGLAARRVQVGVGPEERLVRSCLIPTHQQLSAWRLEKTTNVSCETDRQVVESGLMNKMCFENSTARPVKISCF